MSVVFRRVDAVKEAGSLAGFWNLQYPELPYTEDEFRREQVRHTERNFKREFFVELEGRPVGAVYASHGEWTSNLDHLISDLWLPTELNAAVLPAFLEFHSNLAQDRNAKFADTFVRDSEIERRNMLESAGYKVTQVAPASRLTVAEFDPVALESKLAKVREQGIVIRSAAELEAAGIEWKKKLFDLTSEIVVDIPGPLSHSDMPFDHWVKALDDEIYYRREWMLMAFDGDQAVGYSRISPSDANPKLAMTGLSGTLRSYRRKGIVTALKVKGIENARASGIEFVQTDNDENNPMFAINVALGFKTVLTWMLHTRELD